MITIAKVKNNECQKLLLLEQTVWKSSTITSRYDIANFVRFGYAFCAKKSGKMIGALIAIRTKNNEVNILDWFILESYRRKGIGIRLYKRLQKEVGPLPLIAFVKCSNVPSLKGHLQAGFRKSGKIKDPYFIGEKDFYQVLKV